MPPSSRSAAAALLAATTRPFVRIAHLVRSLAAAHAVASAPDRRASAERRRDNATRLLRQALDERWCPPERLAAALGVDRAELTRFGSRQRRLSPHDRLSLAAFLKDLAPECEQALVSLVRAEAVTELGALDLAPRRPSRRQPAFRRVASWRARATLARAS